MLTKDTLQLNIPISKIDEEQRIVTGIATTEALDSQGDIVDYEASKKAFSEWKNIGNIREMHDPIAVGKAIDVQFDDENKQVIVSAKISESADGENAWIKVKEGILGGFSIGGRVFEVAKDKAIEGANRIVDYALSELSLVDNPACPEAKLIMVKSKNGTAKTTDIIKAGVAVVDGDPRDAVGNSVAEAINGGTPVKAGTAVPKRVYHRDGVAVTVKTTPTEIKKSVYDAQQALSLAAQLVWLIQMESDEPDQAQDLITAFNSLRDFVGKEVAEGDDFDWQTEYAEVIELANKAIELRKGKYMAEKKKLEKTNVIGGEERDVEATVVTTAEEAGRPINDTEERAAEAGVAPAGAVVEDENGEEKVQEVVHADVEDEEVAEAKAEEAAEVEAPEADEEVEAKEDATTEEVAVEDEKKSDAATSLLKNVETLLTKLSDEQGNVELKKANDLIKSELGKVAKSIASLEDRVAKMESQPLPTKGKHFAVVAKGDESEVDTETEALLKRQEEIVANPSLAKPGEVESIYKALRAANIGTQIKVS